MDNEIKRDEAVPESTGEAGQEKRLSDSEVMQHTANIWRYRTVLEDKTELHTEFHSKYIEADGCEVIAARARGKKHKHEGTNCDDWFEFAEAGGCIIAAVSDGAGSRPLSRIGARVSCETAVSYLKRELCAVMESSPNIKERLSSEVGGDAFMSACSELAPLIQGAVSAAYNAVLEKLSTISEDAGYISALGRSPAAPDLSSTLLAAVVIPLVVDGGRQSFVMSAQIGDGCICVLDSRAESGKCLRLLGEADSGAYSGETEFLSAKTAAKDAVAGRTRISRGASDTIMLMTDGVADDYYPAQPMMLRLYIDLYLNGVLPMTGDVGAPVPPAPISYPSISPDGRSVSIQYAKQLSAGGEAVTDLWDRRDGLNGFSLRAYDMSLGRRPQDKLLTWLDNYNERGSFDDRTLVIIRLNRDLPE